MSAFNEFNLIPELITSIEAKGYTCPTPIQEQAVPLLMKGADLLGIAQTGTGKTAAFALPILNKFSMDPKSLAANNVRCLVLAPTRELASQIEDSFKTYGAELNLHTKVVFGGVSKRVQEDALGLGVDVLVATPGRLLDLMESGKVDYKTLDVLVLDEADTMLDMGFLNDVKRIISKLPKQRQTLLFSATMPPAIAELANSILKSPEKVEITPESSTVESVDQRICFLHKTNRMYYLLSLLEKEEVKSVLVFSKTKFNADRIVEQLDKVPVSSAAIHSDKTQGQREKALAAFKEGEIRVLVATDVAARGIDVPHVSHVVNYNLPEDPSNYVHRIGRTARAGRKGVAITLCVQSELPLLSNVEKKIKMKIPVDKEQPFHEDFDLLPEHQKKKKKKFGKKKRRR